MITIREANKDEYISNYNKLSPSVLQSYSWGEVKKYAWRSIRLEFFENGNCSALATVLTRKIPILNKEFGYLPRGILIKDKSNLKDVLAFLIDFLKSKKLAFLILDPDYSFRYGEWNLSLEKALSIAGFKKSGSQFQPGVTCVIDLTKGEDFLLSDMRSKTRQYIRKALKNGVKVMEGSTDNLEEFCEIAQAIKAKQGHFMHSCKYYKRVWEEFSKQSDVNLFMAKVGEKIVGSMMILSNKQNVFELYGGCTEEGNKLLANYLLKWEIIKSFQKKGFKYYDQWGIDAKFPGLYQFKTGFGGKVIEFLPQYVWVNSNIGWFLYKVLSKLRGSITM